VSLGVGKVFDFNRAPDGKPSGPWWKNLKVTPAMGVAVAVLIAGSAIGWYLRSTQLQPASNGPTEGSLRVNLNTATLTELETIPGIGATLAKQIVAYRPYTSINQLVAIRGIGTSSVEKLRPYVKVEGESEKLR
jgi:competence ComEA-like helix-hairpin-helix protein